MSYSRPNTIWSELVSDEPLTEGTLAYLEARAKNTFYNFVMEQFQEAEKDGFTKAQLARRLGKRPDQISRLLGAPGNWTIETVSALLAGISKAEIIPASRKFIGRPPANISAGDLILDEAPSWRIPSNRIIPSVQLRQTEIGTTPPLWNLVETNLEQAGDFREQ